MIDGRGQARITDFGLALRLADELESARSGQAGGAGYEVADVAGTLAYMAPERFEGKPATVQSDLYALGLILYETYTGKPAFKADSFREWQRAHSDSTPTSPAVLASDVEPAVERAILRCLEKDPTRRPKLAAQVAGGYGGESIRVEAAARAGRVLAFRLFPRAGAKQPPGGVPDSPSPSDPSAALLRVTGWTCLVVLAVLARGNLQNGRGDRHRAMKLAVGLTVLVALTWLAESHSPLDALAASLGPGLIGGLAAWVFYLAVEPAVRRAWPYLLISSTRLIDGRWRDPLVGRSLLAGVLGGVLFAAPWSLSAYRLLDLPGSGPGANLGDELSLVGGLQFLASLPYSLVWGWAHTGLVLSTFLVARLVVRRTDAAGVVVAALFIGIVYFSLRAGRPVEFHSLILLGFSVFLVAIGAWVLWRHGALALAVSLALNALLGNALWTLDMSRWYAWRQWVVVAMAVALALWGFRNVLGRQSAFPAGALDG